MKELVINTEKINIKINKVKNYVYMLLCVVRKKIFRLYSTTTIFYETGLCISPSGHQWATIVVLFGFNIKIINRTVHYT